MSAVLPEGGVRAAWQSARERVLARWQALGARERQAVGVAALVLGVFLAWSLAIAPAWQTLSEAPAQIDRLDAQLQQMRRLAAETRELRDAPVVGSGQAVIALRAATARLGEHGRLTLLGDRATLTLNGATGEELRRWLAEARSGARVRPVEATLSRATSGYNGTLIVALSSGGTP